MRATIAYRLLGVALITACACLFLAGPSNAQQPPNCQPWINQDSWTGTISFQGDGQVLLADGRTVKIHESATVTFTTDNPPPPGCFDGVPLTWLAGVGGIKSYSAFINDEVDTPCQSGGQSVRTDKVVNGIYPPENADLQIDPFAKTYRPNMNPIVNGVRHDYTSCNGTKDPTQIENQIVFGPRRNPNYLTPDIVLPTTGVALSGTISYQAPGYVELFTDPPISWTVTWNLVPTPKNLDLVVTIPNYQTWRPAGGKTEKEIGTDPVSGLGVLELDAQLIDKDTGVASTVPPDKVTFSLVGVSKEPGVSMNWPAKADATTDPDLAFDAAHNPSATLSAGGSKADFTPPNTSPVAAFVSPHDWGAWATLNVTATFNGVTYQGHLKGADKTTDILLPKRQKDSHIADIWKTNHNVPLSTPDDDDAETNPVGYPGCNGDGYTTYEEYRGFMEKSKHIEGDTTAKDFFIQNLIGADAEPGIFQFTAITGLKVHKDIQKNEMEGVNGASLGDRLINFNHAQGAHVTDEHGVIVATCTGTDGGITYIKTDNGKRNHGRPGLSKLICMQGRNSPGTLNPGNTHDGAIAASDASDQFDLGVAHELAHSVGVEHHGDGDTGSQLFSLLGPDDPRNAKKIPAFLTNGTTVGTTITVSLLDEETGTDRAPAMWDKINQLVTKECGTVTALYGPGAFSEVCNTVVNHAVPLFADLRFHVGLPHKQHSGDDQCIMRYFFANAYPSATDTSIYYISKPGTENRGVILCTSPAGSGVNSPSHKPQSRYSDASNQRGACEKWVCVSDKYPPIPD